MGIEIKGPLVIGEATLGSTPWDVKYDTDTFVVSSHLECSDVDNIRAFYLFRR